MKKIIIIGGGGYVGADLVPKLLEKATLLRFMIYLFMA